MHAGTHNKLHAETSQVRLQLPQQLALSLSTVSAHLSATFSQESNSSHATSRNHSRVLDPRPGRRSSNLGHAASRGSTCEVSIDDAEDRCLNTAEIRSNLGGKDGVPAGRSCFEVDGFDVHGGGFEDAVDAGNGRSGCQRGVVGVDVVGGLADLGGAVSWDGTGDCWAGVEMFG